MTLSVPHFEFLSFWWLQLVAFEWKLGLGIGRLQYLYDRRRTNSNFDPDDDGGRIQNELEPIYLLATGLCPPQLSTSLRTL